MSRTKIGEHGKMVEMFALCEKCQLQYKIVYEDGSTLCTYCGKSYDVSKEKEIHLVATTQEKTEI